MRRDIKINEIYAVAERAFFAAKAKMSFIGVKAKIFPDVWSIVPDNEIKTRHEYTMDWFPEDRDYSHGLIRVRKDGKPVAVWCAGVGWVDDPGMDKVDAKRIAAWLGEEI